MANILLFRTQYLKKREFSAMGIKTVFKNQGCEWIDVEGATAEDLFMLHEKYKIDPLLLEDTVDPNHLPKYEDADGLHFFLLRENTDLERSTLNSISDVSTKLGIFLLEGNIITVHRMKNRSVVETLADLAALKTEINADQIALKLALKVIKSFDDESQNLLEIMDNMENEIFLKNSNSSNQLRRLYRLKRKSGMNTRILNMSQEWTEKFSNLSLTNAEITDMRDKYKDVLSDFDHLNVQATNLISMFLALSDQKANQVMKVLAQYSVYFLPITFVAGLYGMNFRFMPELEMKNGYWYTLGLMGLIVVLTFLYMRKKRW